ncbi:unnamed protein product [Adineta steineri]|uniref:Uncharacterized protein n=1 Tax=Adineta steineri TaxID=433720 RepID=A0A815C969_9BILA|nr:unnamed protein product [Adineta steineri]CAF1529683.1 unnamed protein product [Adineta steineri]
MSCTDVIDSFRNQDNFNKYSLNQFTLHVQVVLPGIETTFLSVRIQKFIYSNKIKTKMNQSTNVEVRGNYHDNICGIDQEGTYSLDLWIFPVDNKIEEPIFTFESIIIQQVQGVQSGQCNQDLIESIEPFNELATYYAQMAIKDLDLNQQHHPSLNACHSLASTLHDRVTWHSTHLRLIQLIERFPRLEPFLIILNKYGLHLKDILNGEKNGLDRFVGDDEVRKTFQQIKTLLNSDPIQFANAQQTFNIYIINQRNLSIIYDETIDLYDSKTFDIIFSSNQLQENQDLINSLIDLRRLLELVHISHYFHLIVGFIDQW